MRHRRGKPCRILQRALVRYQAAVFHVPQFAQNLKIPQFIIAPSIDPLSDKNRELGDEEGDGETEAAESLYGPYRWGRYDLLVLDTPPNAHAPGSTCKP